MIGRVGIGMMVAGVLVYGAWTLWFGTRVWCPVDVPIDLRNGMRTKVDDFRLNVSGPYDIEIEASASDGMMLKALACSLGVAALWSQQPCSAPSVLRLVWVVTSNGKVVAQGSSDEISGGASTGGSVSRLIGSFRGERGSHYGVEVESRSNLVGASTRLKVESGGTAYEYFLVAGGLIRWCCAGLAGLGLAFLIFAYIAGRKSR